ncbi:hypothetical protein O181_043132 [Austropuccinia psidii MF-1]|uniref:Uncharacterized protein n=1 Tax=Austropuccinia psidii MF-1 TaxID=1389203 RepID=A0A9Q3DP71_9BASI|nr:hypothetical protein [Austropuccinia psidii MF-1]
MTSDIFHAIPELYEAINDVKSNISHKDSSIFNNLKTINLSLSQINETLVYFEKVLRAIKTSNNDNSFGNKLNEKSTIIKESTIKYFKFNIEDIIETRIKQAIGTIKEENENFLDNILKSFTEVKAYTIALKKCFDTSKEEISKFAMKFAQITSDNTRQTELWQELTQTEDNNKTNLMNLIKILQYQFRNSQRHNNSKMNDIEQLLHTLPRMSTPLNQNEGTIIPNKQVLKVENSQLKSEPSSSSHTLGPSMAQALLKEYQSLKNGLISVGEETHGHQILTWWKIHIINKWANDAWRFKFETAFQSAKFNADNNIALPWLFQQKDRLTALYPEMSEFIIHRKILRQCGRDLEHAVKISTTEESSAEEIINILEEVTTGTRIGSSRVNLKKSFNTPWKDSADKNSKENSNNLNEAEISLHLPDKQESELSALLYDHKEEFASDKEPLGAIIGHEVDIILNIERPYPPLSRGLAYPASPKSREALEIHIKEPLDLGVIRQVGHNEKVEITTPVIVVWHIGKSRMVGDFGALNTCTDPNRYPIPKLKFPLPRYLKQCI